MIHYGINPASSAISGLGQFIVDMAFRGKFEDVYHYD